MYKQTKSSNPLGGIVAIIIFVFLIWLVINFVRGLFSILTFLALPLFIIALVLNYRVVTGYFKLLWRTIKKDPGKGVLYSVLSIIGYPLVSAWLFFKAFTTRRQKIKEESQKPGEYLKFEEVEEEEDFLELPDIDNYKTKEKSVRTDNKYDDLF